MTTIVWFLLKWLIAESGTHEIPSRWCIWKMVNTEMHWQSLCWLSLSCRSHITHGWVTHSHVFHIYWDSHYSLRKRGKRRRGRELKKKKGDAVGLVGSSSIQRKREAVYAVGPYIHYWLDTRVRQGYKDKCWAGTRYHHGPLGVLIQNAEMQNALRHLP